LQRNTSGERQEVVNRVGIHATSSNPALDWIASLAARLFQTPVAVLSLFTTGQALRHIQPGFDARALLPRLERDAAEALAAGGRSVVSDPSGDGFSAAIALTRHNGAPLGTLSIADSAPRALTPEDARALEHLARLAASFLAARDFTSSPPQPAPNPTTSDTSPHSHQRWHDLEIQILALISSGAPPQEVLEQLALAMDEVIEGARSSIMLVSPDGKHLHFGAAPHLPAPYRDAIDGVRIEPNLGSCGRAVSSGEQVITADMELDPAWEPARELVRASGLRACWSTPVRNADGRIHAVWALYFSEPRQPTPDERRLLANVAHLVGIAMEGAHKRAALEQSQAMLAMASRLSRVGAWQLRLPALDMVWSKEVRQLLEVDSSRMATLPAALDFAAAEHRDAIERAFNRCLHHGEPFDEEWRGFTATGRQVWVRVIGEAERDATGNIIGARGALQDLTDHKQAEAERLEAERRFRHLVENIEEVFWISEPWLRGVLYVSPAYERIWGRTRQELYQNPTAWLDAVHEDDREQARAQSLRYHVESAEGRYRIVRPDGAVRWIVERGFPVRDAAGAIEYVVGTARDVTERVLAEENLRRSEERFRLVARATSDVIWDWDIVTGAVWCSDGIERLFGHRPAIFHNNADAWLRLVHPDDAPRVQQIVDEAIQGPRHHWSAEYRFQRHDGTYATVVDRAYVIRDNTGKAVRMVGSMADVSEQRELEERMRQSQRLEALGQLTGGIAHDFNNLLTVILGNAELLAQSLQFDSKLGSLAEITRKAALQGAELTGRLLAFARRQALQARTIDIVQAVHDMDGLLRRVLGEHVELRLECGCQPRYAHVDAGQLENAILNLCINARDAMPHGGQLVIRLASVEAEPEHHAAESAPKTGPFVRIEVADTGSGIKPEFLGRVFEPFFTTKEVGKGSGLGLSMVYGFVRQSNGFVTLHSQPGSGTTVSLFLPETTPPATSAPEPLAGAPCGAGKILVVEDEELVRHYVTEQLQLLGYAVVTASTAPEALELLRGDGDFDLLFTDIVMPGGMSGRALAEQARKLRPSLAVLFTSGYAEDAVSPQGQVVANIPLLAKPYRPDELASMVQRAIAHNHPGARR
jgi:PAS domain S-box-containing protein